jgi:hypothetical protein
MPEGKADVVRHCTAIFVSAAAGDLTNIGSAVSAANAAAAASTTGLLAAGADEVSEAIAALFGLARPGVSGGQRARGRPMADLCKR